MMKSEGFYYGGLRSDGVYTQMCDSCFTSQKNIVLDIQSHAVKQKIIELAKKELSNRKIPYTDFCIADGSGGIFCSEFKIIDSDFYTEKKDNDVTVSGDIFSEKIQEEIEKNAAEKNKNLLRAQRFISACNNINNDVIRLTESYINRTKINRFSFNLWQKISNGMKGHIGTETKRYVTCLTAEGVELNMSAFDELCKKMLVINDRTGACARIIIDRLRRYAISSGYDIISCPCTVNENLIEHLIIPELEYGVFTSKHYHRDDFNNVRKIYAKRFLYPSVENIKVRTDFSIRTYRRLMDEVFVSLENIKETNRNLDKIILVNTDINKLNKIVKSIILNS